MDKILIRTSNLLTDLELIECDFILIEPIGQLNCIINFLDGEGNFIGSALSIWEKKE